MFEIDKEHRPVIIITVLEKKILAIGETIKLGWTVYVCTRWGFFLKNRTKSWNTNLKFAKIFLLLNKFLNLTHFILLFIKYYEKLSSLATNIKLYFIDNSNIMSFLNK